MKKVLICINNLDMGGIQKSLIELLKSISNLYEITLFCIKPGGILTNEIPENINIIYGSDFILASELSLYEAKQKNIKVYFTKIICTLFSKLFTKKIPAKIVTKFLQKNLGYYDVSISYSQPVEEHKFFMLTNEIVLYSCKSNLKLSWVHCDFEKYGGNTAYNKKMYQQFDRIVAVSDSVKEKFIGIVPELKNKMYTVYNFHDYEKIIKKAQENPKIYKNFSVISIARMTEEKGLLRMLPIIKKIKEEKFDFSWHVVGDGPLRKNIEEMINEYHLEEIVILHGLQSNPYKYLLNSDLLLVPSYHEAAPMVFEEARVLNIPILTTDTLSAKELVGDKLIGIVCKNSDEDLEKSLREIISNYSHLKKVRQINNVTNDVQINQFRNAIGD